MKNVENGSVVQAKGGAKFGMLFYKVYWLLAMNAVDILNDSMKVSLPEIYFLCVVS